MSWYSLTLSADKAAVGKALECREAFERAFAAAQGPRSMALFQREREDQVLELFFTPECVDFAKALLDEWGCAPCPRPSLIGLKLLVGHNEITYYMPP